MHFFVQTVNYHVSFVYSIDFISKEGCSVDGGGGSLHVHHSQLSLELGLYALLLDSDEVFN